MARGGINLAVVKIAREALLARGKHPSIDAVRVELGNTGSKSTIQRYLKELDARQRTPQPPTVDEQLHRLIAALGAHLTTLAEEEVADDRRRLNQEQAAYEQRRLQLEDQLEHLRQAHATLGHELQALREHERALQQQLRDADGEGRRLAQSERSLQELLGERAAQVQSLEDKLRHAREALDHYRQQHLAQRDQETQRHDSQLHQVQHELRGVRAELLTKQEELAQAYQGNERLVGELRALQRQDRQRDLQLQQLRQERADADNRHQNERVQLQTLTAEHSGLRERVKRHVLTERQHRRELRAQRQQNAHLQTLLDHLTTSPPPSDDQ